MLKRLSTVALLSAAYMVLGLVSGHAQQQGQRATLATTQSEGKCTSQHIPQAGVSAFGLVSNGYEIKAAVPGGLWLQRQKDVFFCNSGITADDDTMCWKLSAPLKAQGCTELSEKTTAKSLGK